LRHISAFFRPTVPGRRLVSGTAQSWRISSEVTEARSENLPW
jgi:hypothetical protein